MFLSLAVAAMLMPSVATRSAKAQTARTAEPNRDTEILFLGTAGGPPLRENRSEPSTMLVVDGRSYLIDCGIGTMRRMLDAGIQSEQVETIFFTHLHSDHDLGLADVMANDYFRLSLSGSAQKINIYGPPQTKEFVDAAFRYITISVRPFAADNPGSYPMVHGEFASPFIAHEIEREGTIMQDDKIRVTAVENTHYALMPAQSRRELKSYSYRIETPHGAVVFTGDTGPSDAVARLADDADVLVAETDYRDAEDLDRFVTGMARANSWSPKRTKAFRAHMESEHLGSTMIGELASKAHVKSVVLYHYDPRDEADKTAYVSDVKKSFAGPVFAPDDLDRYCLGNRPDNRKSAATLSPCGSHK
ncbi:MAG: MBL fold metallo-hydrolase [Vicinamibacterales bacterium]